MDMLFNKHVRSLRRQKHPQSTQFAHRLGYFRLLFFRVAFAIPPFMMIKRNFCSGLNNGAFGAFKHLISNFSMAFNFVMLLWGELTGFEQVSKTVLMVRINSFCVDSISCS